MLAACVGLGCVVAGPVALALVFDQPFLRSSGLPAWPLMVVGCGVSLAAAHFDRRIRVVVVAAVAWLLTLAFAWGFWIFARMPATPAFASLVNAPDFALPDHDGSMVALAQLRARGPVHIVFYRGFW